MKHKYFLIIIFTLQCFSFSLTAKADQLAVLTLEQAKKTNAYFRDNKVKNVILWCACCKDDPRQELELTNYYFKFSSVDGSTAYYRYFLEGILSDGKNFSEAVDLAYVHILLNDGIAQCLGKILNFECDPCTSAFTWSGNKATNNSAFDIYIAGIETIRQTDRQTFIAKYWKNGTEITLTDGRYNAVANFIYVDSGDVYITGFEDKRIPNSGGKYWINGKPVDLPNCKIAHSILVSNQDVYVLGRTDINQTSVSKYWKNGMAVNLCDGKTTFADAKALYIYNNDIYVVGEISTNTKNFPCYWVNGKLQKITNVQGDTFEANGICISENTIYISGWVRNKEGIDVVTVWKKNLTAPDIDFILQEWTDGTVSNHSNGITASNGSIYLVGNEYNTTNGNFFWTPKYWQNGLEFTLSNEKQPYNEAKSIAIHNDKVFIVGKSIKGSVATLWINENPTLLSGKNKQTEATSVFIATKIK